MMVGEKADHFIFIQIAVTGITFVIIIVNVKSAGIAAG